MALSLRISEEIVRELGAHYGQRLGPILQRIVRAPPVSTLRANTIQTTTAEACSRLRSILGESFEVAEGIASLPDAIGVRPRAVQSSSCGGNPVVVVDARCAESVLRGADVFSPGVLGSDKGIRAGDGVSIVADLAGILRKGEQPGHAGLRPTDTVLVADGVSLLNRTDLRGGGSGVAVRVTRRRSDLSGDMPQLNGILVDSLVLQNLPSIVAGHALAPAPGSRVIDMCSAPGGKGAHLAALMRNTGELVCVDRSASRAGEIASLFSKQRVTCAKIVVADSTKLKELADGSFDHVLLDAPCSGIGLRPRLVERSSLAEFQARGPYQRKLFREAHRLLKAGGTLVYSTCTMNPDEGEAVVQHALSQYPDIRLIPTGFDAAPPGLPWPGLLESDRLLIRRFTPPASEEEAAKDPVMDTCAFFIAKFEKRP